MKCPKCGFTSSDVSCPKCGVVFAKLRAPRQPRLSGPVASRVRPEPRSGVSILNVVVLMCVFVVVGLVLWHWVGHESSDGSVDHQPPVLEESDSWIEPDTAASSDEAASGEAEILILPGSRAHPLSETTDGGTEVGPSLPDLPPLDRETVTEQTVGQFVDAARQFPEEERLRQAVSQAYLTLAVRRFSEGRYNDVLRAAKAAEDWEAPPRDVAWLCARASLELRDLDSAMAWAQAALAFGPDADMYDVLGHVYYLREEMDRAVEAWKNALSLDDRPKVRASLEKALREMEVGERFDKKRLSHFIVRYEGESMEDTGRLVLGSLERSHAYLKSTLGFEPDEPVVVILYPRRDYAELGGPHWSAGLFDGKVRLPVRGLVSLDRHVEATLRHELTHAFLFVRAGEACPRWLQEGVAEYCEGARADAVGGMLAERIVADGSLAYCLIEQRCDVRTYYPAALSVVDYMLRSRGLGGLRDVLQRLGGGETIDQALQAVYGRDEIALVNEWQNALTRRY